MAEETVIIEEEKESQFTFRNMGKSIVKFKWWIIGASVVGMVGGYLAFRLGLNYTREKLTSSFSYDINVNPKNLVVNDKTTKADLANEPLYYSDGSLFSFTEVVSKARLNAVQEANKDAFGSINIDKMARKGGIQITRTSYTDPSSGQEVFEYPARYTLTATRSYFKSEQQGKDFINALINYELAVAETSNSNYEVENFLSDNNASSYGLYVSNLNKQYNVIKDCYSSLIEDFATSSVADKEGSTLNKVNTTFLAAYGFGTKIDKLEGDLYTKHLVDYAHETEASLRQQADAYKENIRNNLLRLQDYQKSIDDLTKTSIIDNGGSNLTTEIIRLNKIVLEIRDLNTFYTKEIINLGYTVPDVISLDNVNTIAYAGDGAKGVIQSFKAGTAEWKGECDAFALSLAETAGKLKNDRITAGDVYGYVNNKYNNQVNFYTPGIAKLQGHLSNVIGLAVGLVLGFVLSTVVCTFVYVSRKEKAETEEQKEESK